MRTADELIESGLAVIDAAFAAGATEMAPLLSGGHDSLCAVHVASQHPRFTRDVFHIDTGIGASYTRQFVGALCAAQRWNLRVFKSPATYERFVSKLGFPGPGSHQWVYNWLKDRCVGQICRGRGRRIALITGCRSQESVRRMGHVAPVKVGETSKKTSVVSKTNRIWTAPCHDWSTADQQLYIDEWGLPRNKLKSLLGMSGECLCGAFAQPGEIDLIRQHCPDVSAEIERLQEVAQQCGTPCRWGTRPQRKLKGQRDLFPTGMLCSGCDARAAALGVEFVR